MKNTILAPISIGELVDKITILEIKQTKTQDVSRLKNIYVELGQLKEIVDKIVLPTKVYELKDQLHKINAELWEIEDGKRQCERAQSFGNTFVELARNVYIKNDIRAAIKKEINLITNSSIIEEKIY